MLNRLGEFLITEWAFVDEETGDFSVERFLSGVGDGVALLPDG